MKRLKLSALRRGDIILTTTTEPVSKAIRWGTKSDISHAMICVQHGSVIDATAEGVHARNMQRLLFDDGCALHVLRLKSGLTPEEADQVCKFARQGIGSEYSTREAVRTVIGGSDQWTRKQFCSRLVAQAYASAGIKLVDNPNYCAPADLADSALLIGVQNAVDSVTDEEASRWAAHPDSTEIMRNAINAVLEGARKKNRDIQTFEDIDAHLVKHPHEDAYFSELLVASGYLTVWQLNTERNRWQYEDELLAELSLDECEKYCRGTVNDDEIGSHRYIINRGGYRALSHHYKLNYFKLMFDLYDLLAGEYRHRVNVARRWLEANKCTDRAPDIVLVPHTQEWFASMLPWDPVRAAVTKFVVDDASREHVCSICGDDPASDYRLAKGFRPAAGPDTLRLCEDCLQISQEHGRAVRGDLGSVLKALDS